VVDFLKYVIRDGHKATTLICDSGAEFRNSDTQVHLRKNDIDQKIINVIKAFY